MEIQEKVGPFFQQWVVYCFIKVGKSYLLEAMSTMITHWTTKVLLVFIGLGVLFLQGCANFIQPEIGATARPDARIKLVAEGVQNAAWNAKDLVLTYSYSEAGDIFTLSGTLIFDRSLTDSFPVAKSFLLKMSFLDSEGRVLQTVNITPLISSYGTVSDRIPVRASSAKPAGASAIAFNYFGTFLGGGSDEQMGGSSWEIFSFPYE